MKGLKKIIKYCEAEIKSNTHLSRAVQHAPDSVFAGYRAKVQAYQSIVDKIKEDYPRL